MLQFRLKRNPLIWYLRTMKPRLEHWLFSPKLSGVQVQILKDMKRDGCAVTNILELFPQSPSLLKVLVDYANKNLDKGRENRLKPYWLDLWQTRDELDLNNPFFQMSFSLWNLANHYLGCRSKLYAYMCNVSKVMPEGHPPMFSQLWHRDHEDMRLFKMFVYLTDVSEDSGPFFYIKGSHRGGKHYNTFPCGKVPPFTHRRQDEEMYKVIPEGKVTQFTGKAGTVIFADTMGLHKGGYCYEKPRVMSMSAFSTRGRFRKEHILYTNNKINHYATKNY